MPCKTQHTYTRHTKVIYYPQHLNETYGSTIQCKSRTLEYIKCSNCPHLVLTQLPPINADQ